MRTVTKISSHGTLNYLDALNFLAMVGIFDESNADALATIAHGGALSQEEFEKATEQIIDGSIEFILKHPDLEYTENTTVMLSLYKTCQINFIERVLESKDQRILSPSKEEAAILGEIVTPRIANKSSDSIEMA
jgi:hypothetical protein